MPTAKTRLAPLPAARARELFGMFQQAQQDDGKAISLDGNGAVTGVVEADDKQEEHLLRDMDAHA